MAAGDDVPGEILHAAESVHHGPHWPRPRHAVPSGLISIRQDRRHRATSGGRDGTATERPGAGAREPRARQRRPRRPRSESRRPGRGRRPRPWCASAQRADDGRPPPPRRKDVLARAPRAGSASRDPYAPGGPAGSARLPPATSRATPALSRHPVPPFSNRDRTGRDLGWAVIPRRSPARTVRPWSPRRSQCSEQATVVWPPPSSGLARGTRWRLLALRLRRADRRHPRAWRDHQLRRARRLRPDRAGHDRHRRGRWTEPRWSWWSDPRTPPSRWAPTPAPICGRGRPSWCAPDRAWAVSRSSGPPVWASTTRRSWSGRRAPCRSPSAPPARRRSASSTTSTRACSPRPPLDRPPPGCSRSCDGCGRTRRRRRRSSRRRCRTATRSSTLP